MKFQVIVIIVVKTKCIIVILALVQDVNLNVAKIYLVDIRVMLNVMKMSKLKLKTSPGL